MICSPKLLWEEKEAPTGQEINDWVPFLAGRNVTECFMSMLLSHCISKPALVLGMPKVNTPQLNQTHTKQLPKVLICQKLQKEPAILITFHEYLKKKNQEFILIS